MREESKKARNELPVAREDEELLGLDLWDIDMAPIDIEAGGNARREPKLENGSSYPRPRGSMIENGSREDEVYMVHHGWSPTALDTESETEESTEADEAQHRLLGPSDSIDADYDDSGTRESRGNSEPGDLTSTPNECEEERSDGVITVCLVHFD